VAQDQSALDPQDAAPITGRRNVARLRLHLPGRIQALEGEYPCIVEDLSQTGARIILERACEIGSSGILRCGMLDIFFDRVWVSGNRAGLAFDEIVTAETLYELRRVHDNFDELQRSDIRQLAHDWVNGLIT